MQHGASQGFLCPKPSAHGAAASCSPPGTPQPDPHLPATHRKTKSKQFQSGAGHFTVKPREAEVVSALPVLLSTTRRGGTAGRHCASPPPCPQAR